MRNSRTIIDKKGDPVAGYTMKIHTYSSASPYYTAVVLYTYTDQGDGTYYVDITNTVRGTIVITTPSGTSKVPIQFRGALFQGDNQLTLEPT